MKWPFKHSHDKKDEADRRRPEAAEAAKTDAEEILRRTKGHEAEVHEIADRLRRRRAENHVAEAINRILRGEQ